MNKDNYLHHFKKSLGQNFLNNKNYINELIDSLNISDNETVVEIGPGKGDVTEEILKRTKNLIIIEKDDSLIPYLNNKFPNGVKIIHKDVLDVNFSEVTLGKPYKVIGSLPYNISKKIIYDLLTNKNKPTKFSLIIQKEVAKEYSAKPPKSSLLSNFASLYSDIKLLKVVPSIYFTPKPKVDGQIITFFNISDKYEERTELWRIIRTGFSSPRKILASNLGAYDKEKVKQSLKTIGLTEKARASELTISQWKKLYELITNS